MSLPFIRTVLGDVDPQTLGACDAHEHVWIAQCHATRTHPEFLLTDVDRIARELVALKQAGIDWLIDCMPGDTGRDVKALVDLSNRTGVAIVASTGCHLGKYYPDDDPLRGADDEFDLSGKFRHDLTRGADDSNARCGIIKIATAGDALNDTEECIFSAAARVHRETGAPIITHTEAGRGAHAQVDHLVDQNGCRPSSITLSHVDRVVDIDYHRAILCRGVNLEYDGHFRWKDRVPNPTVELIAELLPEFPEQIVVGMDAARPRYWTSFGGGPGLAYLVTTLRQSLQGRGLPDPLLDRLYIHNPRRSFSFIAAEEPQPI